MLYRISILLCSTYRHRRKEFFRSMSVLHKHSMSSSSQLLLNDQCLNIMRGSMMKNLPVCHMIYSLNAQQTVQTAKVKLIHFLYVMTVASP